MTQKSRSKGFGKGPGTSFDASGASGTFVPATKAVMDAVPCLHGLSDGEQVAVVEAVEVIAQVSRALADHDAANAMQPLL